MDNYIEKIYKVGLNFLKPLNLDETLELIVKEALKLTNAEYGSIFMEKNGELERVYASAPILYKLIPRRRGITYRVFKTKKPRILTYQEIAKIHPEFEETRARSDIIFPLTNENKSIGILTIQSTKEKNFTQKELDLLKLFVPLASSSIRKSQLYTEVRNALETRDLFISMAAHEFKTPLTTVNGYVQLLKKKFDNVQSIESSWIKELSWETHRLIELAKELLTVERIKSGQLQYVYKECSLKEIISRAIHNFEFNLPSRELVYQDRLQNDKIIGDFDKLLQMLTNLLDNAAKYSPASSKIFMKSHSGKNSIYIVIKDKGMGFQVQDKDQVFRSFYRGKNHTREGMGLGLFLTKNIIDSHHGKIQILSKEHKGTIVKITLPKAN